jgi:hypothetical protein
LKNRRGNADYNMVGEEQLAMMMMVNLKGGRVK